MSAATETSIERLIGEMPDVACESREHSTDPEVHTDTPASHYCRGHCPSCGYAGNVVALCPGFVSFAEANYLTCPLCRGENPGRECLVILGPVKS